MSTSYTIVVDNASPLIVYDPSSAWMQGQPSDPNLDKYLFDTYTVTETAGAFATVKFFGSHFQAWGSKGSTHDFYNVTVDGGDTFRASGDQTLDSFQVLLCDSGNLTEQWHTVVLTNAPQTANPADSLFTIDFVKITSTVGAENNTIEDNETFFQYSPPGAWSTSVPDAAAFSDGNGHTTSEANGTVTLAFVGNAVDLYGAVGGGNGLYAVSIDGMPNGTFDASFAGQAHTRQLLYSARGLSDAGHTIQLRNAPDRGSTALTVDYAQVFGSAPQGSEVPSPSPSPSPSPNAPPSAAIDSSGPSGMSPMVMGGVIGALVAIVVCAIVLVVWLLGRRYPRARNAQVAEPASSIDPFVMDSVARIPISPVTPPPHYRVGASSVSEKTFVEHLPSP